MKKNPSLLASTLLLLLFITNTTFLRSKTVTAVEALVPRSKTFKYVNHGERSEYATEYETHPSYLFIPQIAHHPFMLAFYSTTPNAFTLGLSMGYPLMTRARKARHYSPMILKRWVWSANLHKPVRENATLTFGGDGNLVLAESSGRIAWQTRTANKGVVDLKLLPNGNLVLVNKNGGVVWQSFDYPTDTLLNGQGLRGDGSNKLVSGSYSMVMDVDANQRQLLTLFFDGAKKNSSQRPILLAYHVIEYWYFNWYDKVNFYSAPLQYGVDGSDIANELGLSWLGKERERTLWAEPKYNSTLSMLRLTRDGNLRVYTYNEIEGHRDAWEETYTLFSGNQCILPEKCGGFGLCSKGNCVACPTSEGLRGWSEKCKPAKLPACKYDSTSNNRTSSDAKLVDYYKLKGLSSSLRRNLRDGISTDFVKMKIGECRKNCSEDCKCVGFFYRTSEQDCLLVTYGLFTLTTDPEWDEVHINDSKADGYIKFAK
ncbi:hypothetical protein C5167_028214 [Papaver somniferum]|uniref:epidermis-specific secreted glycoprotein EP1-like n=1 Tax=Papaver somniferum TaxID=3469 RepID=UPI000E701980|nr:epidermis-specific secreted glycoprotein EP1-like [Papaver somniferum]RZC87763.1 hypothetical protein C5167_028214 [Papaver somniferum]